MLKRHGGLAAAATARTVNSGVLPAWYQYCGDERRSVTAPGAQAAARPAARRCLVLRCRAGVGFGRAEGEGVGEARWLATRAGVGSAVPGLAGGPAWPADELAVSSPSSVQPRPLSSPIPRTKTTARRRQYVARETAGLLSASVISPGKREGRGRRPLAWQEPGHREHVHGTKSRPACLPRFEHLPNLQQMNTGYRSPSPTTELHALELMFVDAEAGDL